MVKVNVPAAPDLIDHGDGTNFNGIRYGITLLSLKTNTSAARQNNPTLPSDFEWQRVLISSRSKWVSGIETLSRFTPLVLF
jgi:hypothetical protein